jgi:hypothetical protein
MTLIQIPLGGLRSTEQVIDLRYFDSVAFGDTSPPAVGLLFDGPLSESIANPFEGSDIVVSASIMLPPFRIFTEAIDQNSPVGRQALIDLAVGAEASGQTSWPFDYYTVNTPDRDPYMPDPLTANVTNGTGGYTVSETLQVAASGPTIDVSFQDYLNTDPSIPWPLFGYRVPVFGEEPLSHARINIRIEEIAAP